MSSVLLVPFSSPATGYVSGGWRGGMGNSDRSRLCALRQINLGRGPRKAAAGEFHGDHLRRFRRPRTGGAADVAGLRAARAALPAYVHRQVYARPVLRLELAQRPTRRRTGVAGNGRKTTRASAKDASKVPARRGPAGPVVSSRAATRRSRKATAALLCRPISPRCPAGRATSASASMRSSCGPCLMYGRRCGGTRRSTASRAKAGSCRSMCSADTSR